MKTYIELESGTVLETEDSSLWPKAKVLSRRIGKKKLFDESLAHLQEHIKPEDTIWTRVTHVARSGMSRRIQVFIIRDNEPWNISGDVARVLGKKCNHNELSISVSGCGMDMEFHLIYSLSRALHKPFTCIGKGCPSNDHSNGDKNYEPHVHSDGGYALRQRWM